MSTQHIAPKRRLVPPAHPAFWGSALDKMVLGSDNSAPPMGPTPSDSVRAGAPRLQRLVQREELYWAVDGELCSHLGTRLAEDITSGDDRLHEVSEMLTVLD